MRKTRFVLLTSVVFTLALALPALASAPRSGVLHLTKECSGYSGEAGSFCTITSSNLHAIPVGSTVVYTTPDPGTDTDIVLYSRGGNQVFGHVVLNSDATLGTVTFSGGTGQFKKFTADLIVQYTDGLNYRWDGTYSY